MLLLQAARRVVGLAAMLLAPSLSALEDYAFQNVGRVFSLVGGGLKDFIEFFELDQGNRIFFFFEQHGNSRAGHTISLIFQPVDFYAIFQHVVMLLAQARKRVSKLVGLLDDDSGQQAKQPEERW